MTYRRTVEVRLTLCSIRILTRVPQISLEQIPQDEVNSLLESCLIAASPCSLTAFGLLNGNYYALG
jgi:hypothetical protein